MEQLTKLRRNLSPSWITDTGTWFSLSRELCHSVSRMVIWERSESSNESRCSSCPWWGQEQTRDITQPWQRRFGFVENRQNECRMFFNSNERDFLPSSSPTLTTLTLALSAFNINFQPCCSHKIDSKLVSKVDFYKDAVVVDKLKEGILFVLI